MRGFLFLRLGAHILFRLFRVVFLPDDFRLGEGQTAQIPDFLRIGLVVHDGGEDFYGLVQVSLFVGQFAFHKFGIGAHGQVPGRAAVHSRLELFKNGGGFRVAPQVYQNVRQEDMRRPGDGAGDSARPSLVRASSKRCRSWSWRASWAFNWRP